MGRMRAAAMADEGPIASINIIPFVDIVLVLLVIFMLTSAAIVRATMKWDPLESTCRHASLSIL